MCAKPYYRGCIKNSKALGHRSLDMQIGELIRLASQRLQDSSDSPRLDAELMLGLVLRKSRAQLYTYSDSVVGTDDQALFAELLRKRLEHTPIAHITGLRDFWTLTLKVTPDTLVPRPETEILVEQALAKLPANETCSVLDLGTGSGAVVLSIGSERPHAILHATDLSSDALEVAAQNSDCCEQQVTWHQGDWFDALDTTTATMRFDMIVSNPPYIGLDETGLTDPELMFEPDIALYSGADGLDAIRVIVDGAGAHLVPGGWLLLEHGLLQGQAIRELLAIHNFTEITTVFDLSGLPRVTSGRLPQLTH